MEVLSELKITLQEHFSNEVLKFYLIGSRLSDLKMGNSDYDVVVVIRNSMDTYDLVKRISPYLADLSFKHNCVICVYPIKEDVLKYRNSQFIDNLITKGKEF